MKIRNFSIIAHIDHGKSTLADRMLEVTNTVEKRKMKEQVLDSMELERERGITIKMQPVRMYHQYQGEKYELNLIDTPGHIDFSYEVSRAMKAVEGVILLVDATQGVQAQTLTVLDMAREANLVVIPVLNKIDLPGARVSEVAAEVVKLLNCEEGEILTCSGKTGEGVLNLLNQIVERIPEGLPSDAVGHGAPQALVFDYEYSTHRGVIVYCRVFAGEIKKGDALKFIASGENFVVLEVGVMKPEKTPTDKLTSGEIGYIVTAIKEPGNAKVGDTLTTLRDGANPIPGYMEPPPVVWASIYPESQDDFTLLRQSLGRLRLQDAALSFEEESSGALGRGFRCGFLGMLHLEIITERLKREFDLNLVIASPTIAYDLTNKRTGLTETIYAPFLFPEETKDYEVLETYATVRIITPMKYLNGVMQNLHDHEANVINMENFGDDRTVLHIDMPLREIMRNFFDELKSISSGFASFSYKVGDRRPADVARLDILIAEEPVLPFTKIVARRRVDQEAEKAVEKLKTVLPKQLITIKIQGKALGRIIASRTISAMRKDVTDYLYGGDITRKMKLREKQKKGKKKMQAIGKVNIPHDVFLKMMQTGE